MISRRQKSWIAFLKNVVAVSALLVVLDGIARYALASRHPDPATGRTEQTIVQGLTHYGAHTGYVTPLEATLDAWITLGGAVVFVAALFAIRLIGSYDPQSANLPPRPPGADPFA